MCVFCIAYKLFSMYCVDICAQYRRLCLLSIVMRDIVSSSINDSLLNEQYVSCLIVY